MMTERAMRQRMGTKPKAEPAGMRIAGPRHADMLRRAALLNQGAAIQRQPNRTGLPDHLKAGVEALSGLSLDHVRVHRNSPKPAQVQAHAYAQGSEIHLAPGQEQHLPHEAWHVVQQMQGRVRATRQLQTATPINDEPHLEREAHRMGARAMSGTRVAMHVFTDHQHQQTKTDLLSKSHARHADGRALVQQQVQYHHASQEFVPGERITGHNTRGNKAALKNLMKHRKEHPDPKERHANNEYENDVADEPMWVQDGLNIAHHISAITVQTAVAQFANALNERNEKPVVYSHAESAIDALIEGINPVDYKDQDELKEFYVHASACYEGATSTFDAVKNVGKLGSNHEELLRKLAGFIANSPMNLHLGEARRNKSLGEIRDPNSYPDSYDWMQQAGGMPPLNRTLTARTFRMVGSLGGRVLNPEGPDRSLEVGLSMDEDSLGFEDATIYKTMLENSLTNNPQKDEWVSLYQKKAIHSSGSKSGFFLPE